VSWQDLSQLIIALATLINAALAIRNGRKIQEVHKQTNSLKDELVAEVRTASIALGREQQRQNHEDQPSRR